MAAHSQRYIGKTLMLEPSMPRTPHPLDTTIGIRAACVKSFVNPCAVKMLTAAKLISGRARGLAGGRVRRR